MSDPEESIEAVSDRLYRQGATDGLPVVPPTEERVAEMLRGTDRDPDEELGRLGNNDNPVTVEQLAANAVMAGALPPYLPVLEAGVRALADPHSNSIQSSVSTGSWAYHWLVNGPVREALQIQSSTNAYGPYFRANRAIARALGMTYRNTARIHPGEKDMGVMGNPGKFSMLAGENEAASPWEPYHVTNGFGAAESTITFTAPNNWLQWVPSANEAEAILREMIANTPNHMSAESDENLNATILHAFNPYNAEEVAKAGLTKAAIKDYLVENSYRQDRPGEILSARREDAPKVPPRQTRQYVDADAISIATVGGPGRFNAIVGTSVGGPVTKRIEFPSGWEGLLEEYPADVDWYEGSTY